MTETARATSTAERSNDFLWPASLPASAIAHSSAKLLLDCAARSCPGANHPVPRPPRPAPRGPAEWQEDFTQPCCPQSQRAPPGSTMMCPISPALPEVPAHHFVVEHDPAADPGPHVHEDEAARAAGAAGPGFGHGCAGDVLVHEWWTGRWPRARASRSRTWSQPGSSGGSTTVPSSRSMGPGDATPSPAIRAGSTPESGMSRLISAAMVSMTAPGSVPGGVVIRECLTTAPTQVQHDERE